MRPVFNVPGSGALAFAMGITSGYPVGASITADLRNQNYLTKNEAERLLAFSNNSGPLFIMGAVGVGMFHLPHAGYLLYISHIAACITVGIILKIFVRKKDKRSGNLLKESMMKKLKNEFIKMSKTDLNPWNLFGESIKNAVFTMLAIGGFIIFFSVLINILIRSGISGFASSFVPQSLFGLTKQVTEGIFCGIFEITTGTNFINGDQSAGLLIKLCTCSLVIGWAGLSVHAQVMSIISSTDIGIKPYLAGKALQGIIAAFYTFIGFNLSGKYIIDASSVFLPFNNNFTAKWSYMLHSSIINGLVTLSASIILCFLTLCISKLIIKKRLF
jgi:sporulation integral membrane protein YlbJ